jgi:hypothetical protein
MRGRTLDATRTRAEAEESVALSAIIGGTNSGKVFLSMLDGIQQTGRLSAGQTIDDKQESSYLERTPSNSSFEIS